MADVMASFRALRTGERWTQCPPDIALMRLFAKYPAKDGSQIKKDLTANRVEVIRKGIQDKNPEQAGFS
eukprot:1580334-Rhodomonas_salina.1